MRLASRGESNEKVTALADTIGHLLGIGVIPANVLDRDCAAELTRKTRHLQMIADGPDVFGTGRGSFGPMRLSTYAVPARMFSGVAATAALVNSLAPLLKWMTRK